MSEKLQEESFCFPKGNRATLMLKLNVDGWESTFIVFWKIKIGFASKLVKVIF